MLSRQYQRYRHVVFLDTLRGVRATNLAHSPGTIILRRAHALPPRQAGAAPTAALTAHRDGDWPSPPSPGTPLAPDEERLVRWLFRKAGLDARHYRPETLRRRLEACLRAIRAKSVSEARVALARHPELLRPALGSVLIGVTSFFRDPKVFGALAEQILPQLRGANGGACHGIDFTPRPVAAPATRPLNVWCVGCSEGQELYSVAMILDEQRRLAGSYLLGTDCREEAVRVACAGIYADEAMRPLPATRLTRHFDPLPRQRWQVRPHLRAPCRWRCANALAGSEPGRWDLILCRNMGMYLQPASADRLWASLESALAPGGALVLGKAERPTNTPRLMPVAPCIYRKTAA